MKKQTLIIIALCVLVAAVIALSALGVIGSQGSFTGYIHGAPPTVSPPQPITSTAPGWEQSLPTTA